MAVLASLAWLAPFVSVHPLLAGVFAFACVSAETLVASAKAPSFSRRAILWLPLPIAGLLGVALLGDALPALLAAAIVTALLLGVGTAIGGSVGGAIEHPGHLVVVALVSSLVDAFSVLHPRGPTAQLLEVDAAISVLVLPWPMLGTPHIEPILGVGDVVFAALYLAAARRHALPLRRTVLALATGLALTLLVVVLTARALPALPFLGAAVVAAHPEARRVPREDRTKAIVALVGLSVLFGLLFALR